MADDIIVRLRQTRADMIGTDDCDHYFDCHEAAKEIEKLRDKIVELEKQLNTLLESQLWGVNCKPSAPDWLTKEDREKLLRLSYSLDYVQYATSADFIRSLLARSSPPGPEEA